MGKYVLAEVLGAALLCPVLGPDVARPAPRATRYIFVQDLDPVVGVRRRFVVIYGKLNADGELIADGKRTLNARDANLPYGRIINNLTSDQPRPCYELHSGRLIKGVLTTAGSFVPEVGSAVTRFEDYEYTPDGPPIWNLPGFFMREDEFNERRRWLAERVGNDPRLLAEKARLDAAAGRNK
jgi:hypothetical protein